MAVPPADDGPVAGTDSSGDPTRTATSTLTLLAVVLAVLVVACLGVLTYRYASDTEGSSVGDRFGQLFTGAEPVADSDDAAGREVVMSQANQFMLRINTYGPGDLDASNKLPDYVDRVHEVITSKFTVSFDENVTLAEQSVSQAGYARSAELFSTGVESMDADSATVLVSGVIKGSYPDPEKDDSRIQYEPQPFRVAVSLVLVDGTWLVDDFNPVTEDTGTTDGTTDGTADGTGGRTGEVPPAPAPSAGASTGTPSSGATP